MLTFTWKTDYLTLSPGGQGWLDIQHQERSITLLWKEDKLEPAAGAGRAMERRRSDTGNVRRVEPAMQVVGFHVEGQSASPSPTSILQDSLRKISAGSPTPVIIPPSFQRETPSAAQAAATSRALEFGSKSQAGGAAPSTSGQAVGGSNAATAAQPNARPAESAAQAAVPRADGVSMLQPAATVPVSTASGGETISSAASAPPAIAESSQREATSASARSTSRADSAPGTAPAPGQSEEAPTKSKAQLKAERRAQQEAQRAAKAAASGKAPPPPTEKANKASTAAEGRPPRGPQGAGGAEPKQVSRLATASSPSSSEGVGAAGAAGASAGAAAGKAGARTGAGILKTSSSVAAGAAAGAAAMSLSSTQLFSHLQQYKRVTVQSLLAASGGTAPPAVHPAIMQLGLRYADGSISGANARCIALLHALSVVTADYTTPPGKSLSRDLLSTVNACVDFLVRCRPLSVSMGNAIKYLKLRISKVDPSAPEADAKAELLGHIQDYINEKVVYADRALVDQAVSKVYEDDVILTYAYSSVVLEVLLAAHAAGKRFRVVVVDSRPEMEGREMLRRLLQADIACSYTLLHGLSYIAREATKVFLGAAAVLSNGTVMARSGSAAVAMTAAARSMPVVVCCETYKFHERVQLDAITHNELGDPDALVDIPEAAGVGCKRNGAKPLAGWSDVPHLGLLNLKYDLMPADYVTLIATEMGMIPPTSVPVILREHSAARQEGL